MLLPQDFEEIAEEAKGKEIASIVGFLRRELGGPVVAYIAGLNSRNAEKLYCWAIGLGGPKKSAEARLRKTYHVVKLICTSRGSGSAAPWLLKKAPSLDGNDPLSVLRDFQNKKLLEKVRVNAIAFAACYIGNPR